MARDFDRRIDSQRRVFDLLDHARRIVAIVAAIFGLFVIAYFQDYPISNFVQSLDENAIIGATLIAYYYAWLLAQSIEMKMTRTVYIADAGNPKSMLIQVPATVLSGLALFYFRGNEKSLALAMLVFFVVDVAAWRNVVRLSYKFEARSAQKYERERSYSRLAQLRYYVRSYLRGGWQYPRYGLLFLILGFLFVAAFVPSARQLVAAQISAFTEIPEEKIYNLSFALLFFLYISVAEIIVWEMRLRTRRAIIILDELRLNYRVSLSPVR